MPPCSPEPTYLQRMPWFVVSVEGAVELHYFLSFSVENVLMMCMVRSFKNAVATHGIHAVSTD